MGLYHPQKSLMNLHKRSCSPKVLTTKVTPLESFLVEDIFIPKGISMSSEDYAFLVSTNCPPGCRMVKRFTIIADIEGWRYSNYDIRSYQAALEIIQNYYPERLHKVFLLNVPYLFTKAWKAIYPFIDKNTKKKFIFVDDKKMKETMLRDNEESQLPDIYGGKQPLVPVDDD